MRKVFDELFAAPDGVRSDEISLLAFSIGIVGAGLLFEFGLLQAYSVLVMKAPFIAEAFADGAMRLFGGVTCGLSAIATAMGLKAKLGG